MSEKQFIYLDHVADIRFIAYGETIETLFENAAGAMLTVIADIENIRPENKFDVELEAIDLENLMVDFLSELLFLFDAEETVIGNVTVKKIERETNNDGGSEKYSIIASVSGEPINAAEQTFKTEVKAVTYSGIRVEKTEKGYETEVVLDL
jgi:Uncharacterized conserved protein